MPFVMVHQHAIMVSLFQGNGYIEGKELENFFKELEMARRGAGVVSSGARN